MGFVRLESRGQHAKSVRSGSPTPRRRGIYRTSLGRSSQLPHTRRERIGSAAPRNVPAAARAKADPAELPCERADALRRDIGIAVRLRAESGCRACAVAPRQARRGGRDAGGSASKIGCSPCVRFQHLQLLLSPFALTGPHSAPTAEGSWKRSPGKARERRPS